MTSFLEVYSTASNSNIPHNAAWQDHSTDTDFIFTSENSAVRLKKRLAYPQTQAYIEGSRLTIGYGNMSQAERITDTNLQFVSDDEFYDDEFLYIEIDAGSGNVRIQRDAFSTLPLFCGSQDDRLVIAPSVHHVIELLDKKQLAVDPITLTKYLCGAYTNQRTLFKDVVGLYDRMRYKWQNGTYAISFAPDSRILDVIKNRHHTIGELREHLESTIDRYKTRYAPEESVVCEWSGGIDSAVVAGYLADKQGGVFTKTLFLPGRFGQSQKNKLADFKRRFTINDHVLQLDSSQHHPLAYYSRSGVWRPFYHSSMGMGAHSRLNPAFVDIGATSIFTGIGGDELCEENNDPKSLLSFDLNQVFEIYQRSKPFWWTPQFDEYLHSAADLEKRQSTKTLPIVSTSVAIIGLGKNEQYIEQGLWPVHPLGDPRLYAYCQGLPLRYRIQKNLFKMYMEARRFPASIYMGENEHFGEFFHEAVIRSLGSVLDHYMQSSVLHSNRLIQKDAVLSRFKELCIKPLSNKTNRDLDAIYQLLVTEINLQVAGIRLL